MDDFEVYKSFGQVIGKKELDCKINYYFAPFYLKPYYKFMEWIERCKRWIHADYKLKSQNPFLGCFTFFMIFVVIIFMIGMIYIIGK